MDVIYLVKGYNIYKISMILIEVVVMDEKKLEFTIFCIESLSERLGIDA